MVFEVPAESRRTDWRWSCSVRPAHSDITSALIWSRVLPVKRMSLRTCVQATAWRRRSTSTLKVPNLSCPTEFLRTSSARTPWPRIGATVVKVTLSDPPAERSRFSTIGFPEPSPPINLERTFFSRASRVTNSDQISVRNAESDATVPA